MGALEYADMKGQKIIISWGSRDNWYYDCPKSMTCVSMICRFAPLGLTLA